VTAKGARQFAEDGLVLQALAVPVVATSLAPVSTNLSTLQVSPLSPVPFAPIECPQISIDLGQTSIQIEVFSPPYAGVASFSANCPHHCLQL